MWTNSPFLITFLLDRFHHFLPLVFLILCKKKGRKISKGLDELHSGQSPSQFLIIKIKNSFKVALLRINFQFGHIVAKFVQKVLDLPGWLTFHFSRSKPSITHFSLFKVASNNIGIFIPPNFVHSVALIAPGPTLNIQIFVVIAKFIPIHLLAHLHL